MPQTPPTPSRRSGWPLVCAVLAVLLGTAVALIGPRAVAELRPVVSGVRASAPDASAVSGGTATVPPSPVSADGVEHALHSGLDGAPGTTAAAVAEVGTDRVLAGVAQTRPVIPASNQKLLTALSLAEHVDPYERLATRVVVGETPGELTLVAGGDTLLAPGEGDPEQVNGRAGLGTLAQRTARALRERSPDAASGPVSVAVDTSLFTGADTNSAWDPEDLESGEITRVAPVALYSHRVPTREGGDPGGRGDRPGDPAGAVVAEFAHRLRDELGGAEVTVRASARAPGEAAELGRVESAPVHEQSAYMLAHSDNSLAETLARVAAARSGRDASVAGVRDLLPATLRERGIDTTGLRVSDASGMAAENRVTPVTLAGTVNALISQPGAGPYGRGLPVAGGAGTLSERFDDPQEDPARGITRAKTGTLLDVVALSGYVQRRDGRVLVYSVVLNGVSGHTDEAKDCVDRTVAALVHST